MISQKMDKSKQISDLQAITVKLFIYGDGTKEERVAAAKKMLDRCHPVVVGKEVFFLDEFKVQDHA